MSNLDLKKVHKSWYAPSSKKVSLVNMPPLPYLMIDGIGNPNSAQRYQDAVTALYKMAYGVRALSKSIGTIFTVMPLEGLWSFEGQERRPQQLTEAEKDRFVWTLMILQPEHINAEMVATARATVSAKKDSPALLNEVRFEIYNEGEAAQLMHIGSYDDEPPTIQAIHDHITESGWQLSGTHHEIYLSDPRKVVPEKLKTVIRQPFTRATAEDAS